MKRHATREWSVEEFEDWRAANARVEAVAEAADEEGGPRLSLVPLPDRREVWPTDLLPPASEARTKGTVPPELALREGGRSDENRSEDRDAVLEGPGCGRFQS